MTTPRRRRTFSRGHRFSSVDYAMLSIPTVGFLTLLVPLVLQLFYYGPMTTQDGEFSIVDCTRLSTSDDEASYACSGTFTPADGSDPITRLPHLFGDEGKMPEPGDTVDLTLYESGALIRQGESPTLYKMLYIAGGSFAFVGVFIVWAYVVRWFGRKKEDPDAAEVATPPQGSAGQPTLGTSALTGLPIQPNGWDAEPRAARFARVGVVGILLALSLIGAVIGFGSVIGDVVHRSATPHSTGVVTTEKCDVDLAIDTSNRFPFVSCEGPFVESDNADNNYVVSELVTFEPEQHKAYVAGESVSVTVYQDGTVRDNSGLEPRSVPGLVWGITLSGVSVLLGGLIWLSGAATRDKANY